MTRFQIRQSVRNKVKGIGFSLLSFILISCGQNKETEFYPNGQLKYEVPLKSNKRHGKMTEFYQDGKISGISHWEYGRQHGQSEIYYPNGQLDRKGTFKNGNQDGLFIKYFENGIINIKQTWKDGILDGLSETYYPSGIIRGQGNYNQGNMIEYTEFNDNGKVFSKWVLDSLGYLLDKEMFKENGERDSSAYPETHLIGDTIKKGETVTLTARLYNAFDPIYKDTKLVIGKGRKYLKSGGSQIKDTIAVIKPVFNLQFIYEYKPDTVGAQNIWGQFVSIHDGDKIRTVIAIEFKHSYYVKK